MQVCHVPTLPSTHHDGQCEVVMLTKRILCSAVRWHGCHFLWHRRWLGYRLPCMGLCRLPTASDCMAHSHWHHPGHHQHPARSQRAHRVHHWIHGPRAAPCHDDVQELWLHLHGTGAVLCPGPEAWPLHEGAASCHVHFPTFGLRVVCHCADCRHELGSGPHPQRL